MTALARPYARALLEHAVATDHLGDWSRQLAVMTGVVQTDTMRQALLLPSLTSGQQAHMVIAVCRGELSKQAENLIQVLAENKRLLLLPDIADLYEAYRANREKRVEVEVTTAFELGDDVQQTLASALRQVLEREVVLHTVVDKDLLGGVRIRAADQVIDGSIRGRLVKLGEAMQA